VTEFYRQYLAVAVFVVAAFAMVGAMLTIARILRPTLPQSEKYITYESGSDPLPLFGQANDPEWVQVTKKAEWKPMIEGYLQLPAHLARPADASATHPQRNARRLIGDEFWTSAGVALDAHSQKRVPPLQHVEDLAPRCNGSGADERRAHDEVKRRGLIVKPDEFFERTQSGCKRASAMSCNVHESLVFKTRGLSQEASVRTPNSGWPCISR
jgi:hypothetical protein